jgi:hypothetical protein
LTPSGCDNQRVPFGIAPQEHSPPLNVDRSSIQFIQQALAAIEGVRADVERLPPRIPVMLRALGGAGALSRKPIFLIDFAELAILRNWSTR